MAATAELIRSLHAAHEAWRPIKRAAPNDKAARSLIIFATKATRTRPSAKAGAAQAARIARKAPQTMVKVSKATYGASHTFANFTYIARNGKVPMYDQDDIELSDVDEMQTLADEWIALNQNPKDLDSRFSSPDARRLILSMPRGTDPEIVLQAARATARDLFEDNFDYVYALHTDEGKGKSPNPHVHLTVRAKGHDGKKLAFGPSDLLYMRRVFAAELRQRGVDADATPQIARGARLNNEHSKTYQARMKVEKNNHDEAKPRKTFFRDISRMENGEDREYISSDIVKIYTDLMQELLKSSDHEYQKIGREFGKFINYNFNGQINTVGPQIAVDELPIQPPTIERPVPKGPKL